MDESLKDNNIKVNGLENEQSGFNFKYSLSEIQESQDNELYEGFKYAPDGCIICENNPFEKDDYNKFETPIDKVLGGKIKEGEYRGIDYAGYKNPDKVRAIYGSTLIFVTKKDGHIVIAGKEGYPVYLKEGIKIIPSTTEGNFYVNYANYKGEKTFENKGIVMYYFLDNGITFSDLMGYFGDNLQEKDIFSVLDNLGLIEESIKKNVFGEYYNEVKNVDDMLGVLWYKLKRNIGDDVFNQYISKFVKKSNNYNGNLENKAAKINIFNNPDIVSYLLSPKSKINLDNIDDYIDYLLNNGGLSMPDIGICNPKDAIFVSKYGYYPMLLDIDTVDKIKELESSGITENMAKFANDGFGGDKQGLNRIEGLFGPDKEGINLYQFLSKYPQKLQNLGGQMVTEIDLNIDERRNFCFRGILEMIRTRQEDVKIIPYPGENADEKDLNKRKEAWENIVKEYENLLRKYIALDFYVDRNGERKQIEKSQTFDKIFYSTANEKEDHNGVFKNDDGIDEMKTFLQQFSKNNTLEEYSNELDENGNLDQSSGKKMIEDICDYAYNNQKEKILVYIGTHGGEDGSSGNGWTKEDWLKISKYSNVTIMSPRCYFGEVYNNENNGSGDYIYDQLSELSGFSDKEPTSSSIIRNITDGLNNGLGFHEMQIYSRLKYGNDTYTPLSVNLEYENRITGEKERKNVGLAYEGEGNSFDDNA